MEILETFPLVFCFPKSRIMENGGNRIIQTSKRMTKTDSRRPLFARETGRSSHTISIQSAFGLRFRFVYGLLFSTGRVARTSHIDPTSLNMHDGRVFCFHLGLCVKARLIKWRRGHSPWIIFRGWGGICNDEHTSKNSKNVDFDCIMDAFFDERKLMYA